MLDDNTIKIYNIKGFKYELIQTLNNHTNTVWKILEFKNKVLNLCSFDESIIFYIRDNKEYKISNYKLKNHSSYICCLCILNDGRLVSGSDDNSIIIYNNKTFKPDLITKEHNKGVTCVIQLNSGELISCSIDKTIKLYNIKGVQYEVIQTLNYHNNYVYKVDELKNKALVSC